MSIILSIETSTPISSIAFHNSGKLISDLTIHKNKSHSEYLLPSIKYLSEASGIKMKDIQSVAISKGPGSYTGLRIGTSSAKGLCYGLDVPLIAINTLEAMAIGIRKFFGEEVLLCPMLDARRMEVYCTVMELNGNILKKTSSLIIDEYSFADLLREHKMFFFGDGASKCKPVLQHHQNALFIDNVYPSAIHIGEMAWHKFTMNQFEDLAYFEPFYLKDFIAKKPSAKKLV